MRAIQTMTEINRVAVRGAARTLLSRSRTELDAADEASDPAVQLVHAHLAAIRAAAAVLAVHPVAGTGARRRVRTVWEQLAQVGPRWQQWAEVFAAAAPLRAAVESGRLAAPPPALVEAAIDNAQAMLWEAGAEVEVGRSEGPHGHGPVSRLAS